MPIMIVTNNPRVIKELPGNYPIREEESQEAVIRESGELLKSGWRWSADPAAGYSKHYNPYHTVFLEKGDELDDAEKERQQRLLRVAIEKVSNLARKPIEKRAKILDDYRQLDFELASSTLLELKAYVLWQS